MKKLLIANFGNLLLVSYPIFIVFSVKNSKNFRIWTERGAVW